MPIASRTTEELIADARRRLWRAYVAVRGVDGADEATAEAVAWAWEHPERVAELTNPIGYLYRVGLTRTMPRKRARLPAPEAVELPDVEPGLVPALLALSEQQRAAVWLVHARGWSYGGPGARDRALDGGHPRGPGPGRPAGRARSRWDRSWRWWRAGSRSGGAHRWLSRSIWKTSSVATPTRWRPAGGPMG